MLKMSRFDRRRTEKTIIEETDDDPLCCCEYVNSKGDRTHILAFCCDCEAFDDACDSVFMGQRVPSGRLKEISSVFWDRVRVPWPSGARKVDPEVLLPSVLLSSIASIATLGPYWTVFAFFLIPITLQVVRKWILTNNRQRNRFYAAFTFTSLLFSYLVFEIIVLSYMEITFKEYVVNLTLILLTVYTMYATRCEGMEQSAAPVEDKVPAFYFCRTCGFFVDGRDHHCVWLNCCIGRKNRPWFLFTLVLGSSWALHSVYLTLTTICYPTYIFNRTILVPYTCPDAYRDFQSSICFVTALYGLLVLVLLLAILTHQLRLVWKGVSYLEYKYAEKAPYVPVHKS